MATDVVAAIRTALPGLSPAEARVAEAVLADPERAVSAGITRLAGWSGVSEPTVNRFCRSLGFVGYRAFQLALAQGLVRGTPYVSAHVAAGDSVALYTRKIFEASAAALRRAGEELDPVAVGRAVAALAAARQILFIGLGGSGPVALDAQHKFARVNVPAVAHIDPIMQRIAVSGLTAGDVLVAISSTGRTRMLNDNVALAAGTGATVVALTRPGSPLAEAAGIVLGIEPVEDSELYTPMGSRLAHLATIDVLLTGVVFALGPALHDRLRRLKQSLADTRSPGRDLSGAA
ncbi:MAG: transcriptional regulator HexR [Geminicoccaceae bacterium]